MTPDLPAMLRVAEAATPGPWALDQGTVVISTAPWPMDYGPHWQDWTDKAGEPLGRFVAETATNEPEGAYNADFIATFDPPTVIGLISLLLAQQAESAAKDARIAELEAGLEAARRVGKRLIARDMTARSAGEVIVYSIVGRLLPTALLAPPATGGLDG